MLRSVSADTDLPIDRSSSAWKGLGSRDVDALTIRKNVWGYDRSWPICPDVVISPSEQAAAWTSDGLESRGEAGHDHNDRDLHGGLGQLDARLWIDHL